MWVLVSVCVYIAWQESLLVRAGRVRKPAALEARIERLERFIGETI